MNCPQSVRLSFAYYIRFYIYIKFYIAIPSPVPRATLSLGEIVYYLCNTVTLMALFLNATFHTLLFL